MADKPNVKLEKLVKVETEAKICKDFYIGSTNVLNETYLPKWTGETDAGYKTRIASTAFANMFAPIIDGFAGMIMKKEPIVKGYNNTENIDLKLNTLAGFIKETIKKSISEGAVFVSVETSKELNRAYFKTYPYENLYSYYVENGILKQLVFIEYVEVKDGDFGIKTEERFVVFKIGGGEVWYISNGQKEISKQDTWANSLTEIPVLPIVTGKIQTDFEYIPKLLDIALLNKVHLNLESSLSNVLGVVGNPTPVFYGDIGEDKKTIGVKDALVFTDKSKEGFEWVEIQGSSIGELKTKITGIEAQIDKLTFSMLLNSDSNTIIDAQEKQSKNTSFLSDVAHEAEEKFSKLLQYMMQLENATIPNDAVFEMQKEFDLSVISLDIAFKMLQSQDMSRETFYTIMQTGKLPKDFDAQDEAGKIEADIAQ